MKRFVTCNQWDVVSVPFPFSTHPGVKRRPAVALSNRTFNVKGHTVLAMVTSSTHRPWPGDTSIQDPGVAGLNVPCLVRLKLFTLDNRLILRIIGRLSNLDLQKLQLELQRHLPF
jgi:mRNA interferase MazF